MAILAVRGDRVTQFRGHFLTDGYGWQARSIPDQSSTECEPRAYRVPNNLEVIRQKLSGKPLQDYSEGQKGAGAKVQGIPFLKQSGE